MLRGSYVSQDSPSPRNSVAGSAYSAAGSTRHMLADYNNSPSSSSAAGLLEIPRYNGLLTADRASPTLRSPASSTGLSLMVNYIPSKFGSELTSRRWSKADFSGGPGGPGGGVKIPKQGGGLAAFKAGEDRIGGKALRWTRFKWILFMTNLLLTLYSIASIIVILLTWFNVFDGSEIVRLGNTTELSLGTVAASLGLITSLIGWAGILLNNRMFLSIYALLTWITFAFLVAPGYLAYRKQTYNLEGKVNAQWSRNLNGLARMRIQNHLSCCGYFSPYVEATVSETCYSRSVLPGCKKPYLDEQNKILGIIWKFAFGVVPAQLVVMVAALLCSNHVTYRFGKGMMPERYRLNGESMAVIVEEYAAQLADQYGPEVANKVLEKSRSNLNLPSLSKGGGVYSATRSGWGTPDER